MLLVSIEAVSSAGASLAIPNALSPSPPHQPSTVPPVLPRPPSREPPWQPPMRSISSQNLEQASGKEDSNAQNFLLVVAIVVLVAAATLCMAKQLGLLLRKPLHASSPGASPDKSPPSARSPLRREQPPQYLRSASLLQVLDSPLRAGELDGRAPNESPEEFGDIAATVSFMASANLSDGGSRGAMRAPMGVSSEAGSSMQSPSPVFFI